MAHDRYPEEKLNEEYEEDNGTMPANVEALGDAVIGRKIVSAEKQDSRSRRESCERTEAPDRAESSESTVR